MFDQIDLKYLYKSTIFHRNAKHSFLTKLIIMILIFYFNNIKKKFSNNEKK